MDLKLKELIDEYVDTLEPIEDKLLAAMETPRYTSNRLIKGGDRVIMILETLYNTEHFNVIKVPKLSNHNHAHAPSILLSRKQNNQPDEIGLISLKIILIHEDEVKSFCKNYLYMSGKQNSIKVIKKPKE